MISPRVESAFQTARHLVDDAAFALEIRAHAEMHEKLLARLRSARLMGGNRKPRGIQHRILTSYSSKLVCLVRSLEKG